MTDDENNPLPGAVPDGFRRHWTSRFTKKVTDWIARGIVVNGRHVVVDSIEEGGNPFIEELYLTFRLLPSRPSPSSHQTVWGRRPDPLVRGEPASSPWVSEPRFYFTLTAEIPFKENVDDFHEFVIEHADEGKFPSTPQTPLG